MRNANYKTLAREGVNLLVDPTGLGDEEVVRCANLWPEATGILAVRPSMDYSRPLVMVPNLLIGSSLDVASIRALIFSTCPAVDIAMVIENAQGTTQIACVSRSTGNFVALNIPNTREAHLFNFKDVTYCVTGEQAYIIRLATGADGFEIVAWQVTDNALGQPKPQYIEALTDRLILANLGVGYENWLAIGDPAWAADGTTLGDPRYKFPDGVLAGNGRSVVIGAADEGPITGLFVGANAPQDYPKQKAVYVFKQDSLWTLFGDSPPSSMPADSGTLELVRSNLRVGCVSQRSIVRTPYGLLWCGVDDVWFMAFGNEPYPVGSKLRPLIKAQPPAMRHRIHAAYADGAYRLALFGAEQSPDANTPCWEQYWLDLRNGPPESALAAKWYGPQVYVPSNGNKGTFAMAVNYREGNKLYAASIATLAAGGATTRHVTLVSLDGSNDRDTCAVQLGPRAWSPSTVYAVGDIITPSYNGIGNNVAQAWVVIAPATGTSGSVEPNWAADYTTGNPITDGDLTWQLWNGAGAAYFINYENDSLKTDSEILFDLITPEWVKPGPEYDKLVTDAYLVLHALNSWKASYQYGTDYDPIPATALTKVIEHTEDVRLGVGFLPVSGLDPRLVRKWATATLSPTASLRNRALSLQLRLQALAAYLVETNYNTLSYMRAAGAQAAANYTVNIHASPPAAYADIYAWALAIKTATGSQLNINLVATPTAPFAELSTATDDTFYIPFTTATPGGSYLPNTFTEQQLRSNRFIISRLGFSYSAIGFTIVAGSDKRAEGSYIRKQGAKVAFRDITIRARPFRRIP